VVWLSTNAALPDKKIQVTSSLFLRDLSLFMLMVIYLLCILLFIGKINYIISVSFGAIFGLYVLMVVVQSKY
jgi:membrane protein YdbS with pleckstrin-like domain